MKTTKKRLKGFTLVEMIVVVCLFMMMMACVFSILKPMEKIYKDTYEYADGQAVGDVAARYIEDEVRYANRLYVYDKMDLDAGETSFINGQVSQFRDDFYFAKPGATRLNTKESDTIYVLKILNPKNNDDTTSRGKISRWTYKNGVNDPSEYKEWAVNQGIYNDERKNAHYSFRFDMGTWEDSAGNMPISPSNFSIDMTIFNSKRDATTLGETYMQQTIAFSLVNIASAGGILRENIGFLNTADSTRDSQQVSRYQYYDAGAFSLAEGRDVYFIYTKVPKIEDIH